MMKAAIVFATLAATTLVSQSADARDATLPFGTPVVLEIDRDVNSRDAILGEQLALTVAEDVMLEGSIAIPRGSRAVGEVCKVEHRARSARPARSRSDCVTYGSAMTSYG